MNFKSYWDINFDASVSATSSSGSTTFDTTISLQSTAFVGDYYVKIALEISKIRFWSWMKHHVG